MIGLAGAPSASADLGALTPQGCIQDLGLTDCGPTQQGLAYAYGVSASPDGRSLYVASSDDNAIVRFDRGGDGALIPQGCIADAGDVAGCGGPTQQGLDGARGVAVSPDGKSVYVASFDDDAIVRFDRDPASGALTEQGCIQDPGVFSCLAQQGLDGASSVAVSPDGKSVYVAAFGDDAIVRFDRDPTTGALTEMGCIQDVGKSDCGAPTAQGLNGALGVAVSPDGSSVYVASSEDDAVVRFVRNTTTGALTPGGCIQDLGKAGCGNDTEGLDGAKALAMSSDGASVYIAGGADSAIVRFDRNATTGILSKQGCIKDVGPSLAGCPVTAEGLWHAEGVAVSPDGGSVYVASQFDSAIARFDRAASGALTPRDCIQDVGKTDCGPTAEGLFGASGVAVSPDNNSVYVASPGDLAIVRLARELTGGEGGGGDGGGDGAGGGEIPPPDSGEPGVASLADHSESLRKARVPLEIACAAGGPDCEGDVMVTAPKRRTKRVVRAAGRKQVTLTAAAFSVAAGETETVSAKLTKRGAKLLRGRRKVTAEATLTTIGATGGERTAVDPLKLKRRRR